MEAPHHEACLQQVKEVLNRPVDERKPFQNCYDAADLLAKEMEKLSPEDAQHQHHAAFLHAQRGLVLMDTDVRHEGEAYVLKALPTLESLAGQAQSDAVAPADSSQQAAEVDKALPVLQRCYNSLGALWSERADLEAALMWLNKAEKLYHGQRARKQQSRSQQAKESSSDAAQPQDEESLGEVLESGYTLTVFFLAQVHAHAGSKEQSALYCAATLQRQLAAGEVQLSEWVQNCLQLSSYYVNESAFAIGQYLLEAVQRVCQLEADKKRSSEQESLGTSNGDQHKRERSASWQDVLDEDVAANVHLAWGKLYLYRLVASVAYTNQEDRDRTKLPYPSVKHFPELLRFPSLQKVLPAPEDLPWGERALATSFEAARDLFNAAIPRFNAALEYYKLDGWVTEHVTTQLEVSNLYRLLANFEQDDKRCAAMHKLRVSRLQHMFGELNPQHYLGLCRSIDLEGANAWRDHVDALTLNQDTKGTKNSKAIAVGATNATRHYTSFLDSFRNDETKQLPDRIDEDNEHFFLMAAFSLGRVLHRCALRVGQDTSDSDLGIMVQAYKHLQWIAAYVKRHKIDTLKEEASMAETLAALIAEKVNLSKKMTTLPPQKD